MGRATLSDVRAPMLWLVALSLSGCGSLIGLRSDYYDDAAPTKEGGPEAGTEDVVTVCSPAACLPRTCCNGECRDVDVDKDNCGACGHSCLGGDCVNGHCQPVLLATGSFPSGLATDGIAVYFTENDLPDPSRGIKSCAIGGCDSKPTPLAWNRTWPAVIAVDSTNVYWTDHPNVLSCSKTACANGPKYLFAGVYNTDWPGGMAIDATSVYWSDGVNGTLRKCAKTGCNNAPFTIAANLEKPTGIAVDATSVYWVNSMGGSVMKCPTSGCSGNPTVLASGQDTPNSITVDSANVYFTNWNAGVAKCAIGGCNGTPTVLVALQPGQGVGAIAVDATDVYFLTYEGGALLKCAIGGCNDSPTLVAAPLDHPRAVAVDAVSIYWTEAFSFRVKRLAK